MSKDDVIEVEGVVVEALRNAEFRVRLTNNHEITAYVSGKLRIHSIRIRSEERRVGKECRL